MFQRRLLGGLVATPVKLVSQHMQCGLRRANRFVCVAESDGHRELRTRFDPRDGCRRREAACPQQRLAQHGVDERALGDRDVEPRITRALLDRIGCGFVARATIASADMDPDKLADGSYFGSDVEQRSGLAAVRTIRHFGPFAMLSDGWRFFLRGGIVLTSSVH